jgi:hypothetical protein
MEMGQWQKVSDRLHTLKQKTPDIMGVVAGEHIAGIKRKLEGLDKREKVLVKMKELLNDYDYRFDVMPQISFHTAATTGSTTI